MEFEVNFNSRDPRANTLTSGGRNLNTSFRSGGATGND